ncbi:Protein translocase subunit SecY [Candidatus Tiddalikarchaeum anstoanum]|nr:Protein translocase subunit SecY [Candidatus Tiddalikarchaeum anstoanum]
MNNFEKVLSFLPAVRKSEKKLGFNEKLLWTGAVLLLYFILSAIPLYGLSPSYVSRFESLSLLLAARLGSLISLGIGPIVSGSIILQLLKTADIIKIDTSTKEGRKLYEGVQKAISIFFIIFMNSMYVLSGAIPPASSTFLNVLTLIVQLVFGGLLLMLFDEMSSTWGFGSGISLFIAAGVSQEIFMKSLSPIINPSTGYFVGYIPLIFQAFFKGTPQLIIWPLLTLLSTVAIFMAVVFMQSVKVNIPLSMGKVRGYTFKWPIHFFYTSNMPVIFTTSLIAMVQMVGLILFNAGFPIFGSFSGQNPTSGLASWLQFPTISDIVTLGVSSYTMQLIVYPLFLIIGSIGFSILWVNVGGQDASSVAQQIFDVGLGVPGFRRDKRILEHILARYINPLAVLGGATIGVLAVLADFLGVLTRGTGILLTVMIIYNFYENISKTSLEDANPFVKKLFGAL